MISGRNQLELTLKVSFVYLIVILSKTKRELSVHSNKLSHVYIIVPYFTVSGIQVRYLKIVESSGYAALPWVRYITQSGDYQLRM